MLRTRLPPSVHALTGLCFFAAGCLPALSGNEPREPKKELPASFGAVSANASSASSAQARWRDFFGSAELRALIETALENNKELGIQLQEIIITLNEKSARQGEYLPRLGAWIGAAAYDPSLAALLFGVGVGAIARVVVQIAPAMRDDEGRLLHPLSVSGMLAGIAALYLTGLLVSV